VNFTFVGLLQLVIGSVLLFRSLPAMFFFLMLSGLFGGSAAVSISALGNSSIPPLQFALLFVYMRILMPRGGYFSVAKDGVKANWLLVLFTLYGMTAAYAAPRVFAGQLNVVPMRLEDVKGLFDTVPLKPSSQNITAAVYLLGSLLTTLATYVAVRSAGGIETLVKGGVVIAWVHALSGLFSALAKGTPAEEVFALFRNGTYAQLDQSYQGFVRIDGFFPEASGWASFGFGWFVFNCECWYRSVWARHTGRAALVLGAMLFFSTSSTAYVGLGAYFVFFAARSMLWPGRSEAHRLRQAGVAAMAFVLIAAIAMAVMPGFANQVVEMLLHMTVDKGDSDSGRQRLFWALQGLSAFVHSGGLGIGPGSFRSSSLITAIIGTMGVAGVVTFSGYVLTIVRLMFRGSKDPADAVTAVMKACATTAPILIVPAAVSSPNAHPGASFAIFVGSALALYHLLPRTRHRPRFELKVSRRLDAGGPAPTALAAAKAHGEP
jgi:hypothetical protein